MSIISKKYVAYYRVSTKKQGRSGLGLEAQRHVLALAGAGHSGISMTAQGMLSPVKSLSMLVALGQGLKVRRASTRCLSCPSRDRCAIRPQ